MLDFQQWNGFFFCKLVKLFIQIYVRYFYCNLLCFVENVLTSLVNGVEIIIDRQLSSNRFTIPDESISII